MGIFDFFKTNTGDNSSVKHDIDFSDYKFLSDDHSRFQNGQLVPGNNKGAIRGINIKTKGNNTFSVSMHNLSGNHPVWGNNIQMAEKPMKIISESPNEIKFRGFGTDAMGSPFSDYGITINLENNKARKITLHMHDRNIDIVYKKAI